MLPLALFRSPVFCGATIAAMSSTVIFFGLVFVLSLYLQQGLGYSPLHTGLAFLPLTAVVTVGNMMSGRWTRAYGPRWPVTAGLALSALGFVGLQFSDQNAPYWALAFPLLAIGWGGGLITPATTVALMSTVRPDQSGIAAGVLNSARQTGSALGVAIFGALITAFPPILVGMHVALPVAAGVSAVAGLLWVTMTAGRRDHAG